LAEEKLKLYETIALYHPELTDEGLDERAARVGSIVSEHGGKVSSINKWKKRRLAYPVKKQAEGFFIVIRYLADKKVLADLDYVLRYDDRCLRYLTLDIAQFPGMVRTAKKKSEAK
jgi:small subunit ribosomal protein S6